MKTLAIVQARMGSQRLPGKVMKELLGHPMIYYTLTQLKQSKYIDEVILATSTKTADTPLVEYVKTLGFEVFRGDEENVLERYKLVNDKYEGDVIVRVTGDCPLINPIIADHAITKFLMYDYDYVRLDVPQTFTRGFDTEVFSKQALDRVYEIACVQYREDLTYKPYREHVTYYMYMHQDEFNIGYVQGEGNYKKDINLSVDTMEDFQRVQDYLMNR